MGNLSHKRVPDGPVETEFRKRLRRERVSRKWTQAHMAHLLCDKGVTTYGTTIAKIEAGERAIRADELVAIAELFEVSVDVLLGGPPGKRGQTKDREFLVSALTEAAISLTLQVRSASETLKQALADLEGFELQGSERGLFADCSAGATMLDSAIEVIGDMAFAFDSVRQGGAQPLVITGRTDTGEIHRFELKGDEEK